MAASDFRPFFRGLTEREVGPDRLVTKKEFAAIVARRGGFDASSVSHAIRAGREKKENRQRIMPASVAGEKIRLHAALRDLEATGNPSKASAALAANAVIAAKKKEQEREASPPTNFDLEPSAPHTAPPAPNGDGDHYDAAKSKLAVAALAASLRKNNADAESREIALAVQKSALVRRVDVEAAVRRLASHLAVLLETRSTSVAEFIWQKMREANKKKKPLSKRSLERVIIAASDAHRELIADHVAKMPSEFESALDPDAA